VPAQELTTEQQIVALLTTIEQGVAENVDLCEQVKDLQSVLRLWIAANNAKGTRLEELELKVRHLRVRTFSLGGRIGNLRRRMVAA